MHIQRQIITAFNHSVDNLRSIVNTVSTFDFVSLSAHQSASEKSCCSADQLSDDSKMQINNER